MKTIASHTLVKHGMPYIEPCLRQVIPYMTRCLITVSCRSKDGTLGILTKLKKEFPDKVFIEFEDVKSPGELTQERQKQVEKTTEDWILFLDDDDFWPTSEMNKMMRKLDEDVDGFSINPFQIIDDKSYDKSWHNKYFLKWFRNQPGLHYERPWPRDMVALNDKLLYWKTNPRAGRIEDVRFLHLSYLKYHSFRKDAWAKDFAFRVGDKLPLPHEAFASVCWLKRHFY